MLVGAQVGALLGTLVLSACAAPDDGPVAGATTTEHPAATVDEHRGGPPADAPAGGLPVEVDFDRPENPRAATRLVTALEVAAEAQPGGYTRQAFPHWTDQGGGCDTRERVLLDEAIGSVQRDIGCTVVAGDWRSPYDGVEVSDPAELEIDHVVALHEAWQSGAANWNPATRAAFANDLGFPGALVAVTAAVNQAKSDRDPGEWRPPRRGAWCSYARDWITVKARWGLTADERELRALSDMLETCFEPDPTTTPADPATTTTVTTTPTTTTTTTTSVTTTTTMATPPTTPTPPVPPPTAPYVSTVPAPPAGCDPNYTPCVPVASDVDCAGGSGNGPAYVSGPVQVVGTDIYDLDHDDNGTGCE